MAGVINYGCAGIYGIGNHSCGCARIIDRGEIRIGERIELIVVNHSFMRNIRFPVITDTGAFG